MTLNGHFASKSVSASATNGLASPAFRQNCSKICRYPYTVSDKNVAQGVENGDFRFIPSLASEHFTYMATRQLLDDTTVNDLGHISRSLDCFGSNFSKTVCDTAKVTIDY